MLYFVAQDGVSIAGKVMESYWQHYGPLAFFPVSIMVILIVAAIVVRLLGLDPKAFLGERKEARAHELRITELRAQEHSALSITADKLADLGKTLASAIARAESHAEALSRIREDRESKSS